MWSRILKDDVYAKGLWGHAFPIESHSLHICSEVVPAHALGYRFIPVPEYGKVHMMDLPQQTRQDTQAHREENAFDRGAQRSAGWEANVLFSGPVDHTEHSEYS